MARKPGSLSKDTLRILDNAFRVLEAENPMTLRQVFRLVSNATIENKHSEYQKLSKILSRAREQGEISFQWMVDRSRPEYQTSMWENPKDFAATIKTAYRKDYWERQPKLVEIWTEKDAIVGSIDRLTGEYGVNLRVFKGFVSATKVNEIATFFGKQSHKEVVVFYLGDHDPSGREIETELYSRLAEYGAPYFEKRRLAIHKEDIISFNLPPFRIKHTDTRANKFQEMYGEDCVELDALPPNELRKRIEDAILDCIEFESWDRAIKAEKVELNSIVEICELFPK